MTEKIQTRAKVLIADGSLLDAGMQAAGFSDQKLRALLKEKHFILYLKAYLKKLKETEAKAIRISLT